MANFKFRTFSPLFPVAGKSNYALRKICSTLLAQVRDGLQLQKLLQTICKSHTEGYYYKTFETYDVKFIKQNIIRNLTDQRV
jgi:hypothetical protein